MSNLSDYIKTGSGGTGEGQLYTVSWSAPVANGGETVLAPPYTFTMAMVFINGVMQDQTRGKFSIENNRALLSTPLEAGDEAQMIMGQVLPPGTSDWNLISTDTTLESGQHILIDTNARAIQLTLPAAPKEGELIEIVDIGGNLDVNNVVVINGGKLIMGQDKDLTIKTNYIYIKLLYSNPTAGWRILD